MLKYIIVGVNLPDGKPDKLNNALRKSHFEGYQQWKRTSHGLKGYVVIDAEQLGKDSSSPYFNVLLRELVRQQLEFVVTYSDTKFKVDSG